MGWGGARPGSGPKSRIPENRVKALRDQGLTFQAIADRFGCSAGAVKLAYKRWKKLNEQQAVS